MKTRGPTTTVVHCLAAAVLLASALPLFAGPSKAPDVTVQSIKPIQSPGADAASTPELVNQWFAMWNGDVAIAQSIASSNFALHATLLDGRPDTAISGPKGLETWVAQSHKLFGELKFTLEVGPIVDRNFVVARWVARGLYKGGLPGVTAPAGTPVVFTGTDILRIEGGKVRDYWLNAETGGLMTQLNPTSPSPAK